MGLEPTTLGTTIQCSNQLSYIHRVVLFQRRCKDRYSILLCKQFAHFFHSKRYSSTPVFCFPSRSRVAFTYLRNPERAGIVSLPGVSYQAEAGTTR